MAPPAFWAAVGALLLSRPETYTLQRMFELWDPVNAC